MTQSEKVDGRRARGQRTRDAIVSALLDLVNGGDISPTAQRIADRAGVSVRSVYQHFTDVEGLYADAAERTYSWARDTAKPVDPTLPLAKRIETFVEGRSGVLERLVAFDRASRLVEPGSERIRTYRVALEKFDKDRVNKLFAAELRKMDTAPRSATLGGIDTIASTEAWEHLRRTGQSVRSARQVLRTTITALLTS